MISLRRILPALALGGCALAAITDASAQIRVDLELRRALFIRYEPVIAFVSVTNLTGGELQLADDGNHKWFSFQIETSKGELIPPYNPDYTLSPVIIGPGERIKRGVNITPLYPITEYGTYRVKATIYDSKNGRYYSSSPPLNIEITEGRMLWQQTVGVPDGSKDGTGTRTITLLSHRLPNSTQLYLRIEDKKNGLVYCTHQLGRYVSFTKPDIQVGGKNDIHLLQNVAPTIFLYTHAGLNGEILERKQYTSTKDTRPSLRRDTSGGFQIIGGIYLDPKAAQEQLEKAGPPPSISDRPVPLPKPE